MGFWEPLRVLLKGGFRNRPGQVYYENRGRFLEDAIFKTLPDAPFGEGLAEWARERLGA